MDWWSRARADLARPSRPLPRDELPFLGVAVVVAIGVSQVTDPGGPAEWLLITPAIVAVIACGAVPRVGLEISSIVVALSTSATVAVDGSFEVVWFLPVVMTLYVAWHVGSTIRAVAVLLLAAGLPWFVANVLIPDEGVGWPAWATANLFTFALGHNLRRQQQLIDQLQAAREALAEQAVGEERRRIARELHDLAGHTLAAVLLHVTGARHVLHRDPAEAERALEDVEAVGRSSLDQIRATVAALRTSEHGTDPALAGSADLPALIDEYRRTGLDIDSDVAPPAAAIEGPIGTAVDRIAREALANVARHAPANTVTVRLDLRDDDTGRRIRLVVADHGRPAAPPDAGEGHFGVIGMRERARALGGDLDAHPTADGWRVEATLPISAPATDRMTSP